MVWQGHACGRHSRQSGSWPSAASTEFFGSARCSPALVIQAWSVHMVKFRLPGKKPGEALLAAPGGVRNASGSRKRLPSTVIRPAISLELLPPRQEGCLYRRPSGQEPGAPQGVKEREDDEGLLNARETMQTARQADKYDNRSRRVGTRRVAMALATACGVALSSDFGREPSAAVSPASDSRLTLCGS